jgi:ADP-dependent NAD(P)H-hydrate dehydratase / NAD(P)H-hydrate epimerase
MRILTSAEMAALDRAAQRIEKIPSLLLMERAAEGVVELIRTKFSRSSRVAVVCGPGNNGGDGLAAARLLAASGAAPRVFLLAAGQRLRGDAAVNLAQARAAGLEPILLAGRSGWNEFRAAVSSLDVMVDALFGTGLSRPLAGLARKTVETMNASRRPVVSIDVPSGLSGDSGNLLGAAIEAEWTAAIAALKRCHVLFPARRYCGEIAIVDIGIPDELVETGKHRFAVVSAETIAPLFPRRPEDSHKGDFGHVAIVAGSRGKSGAALLCALGALRGGAGLVTIACPESIELRFTSALPEAMTLPLPEESGALSAGAEKRLLPFLEKCTAAAVGPGLGTAPGTQRLVRSLVSRTTIPILFDADALNAFSGQPETFRDRKAPTILTPHPGEAARLISTTSAKIQRARPESAAELARRTGTVTVLKGAGSLTADRTGRIWWNPTGSPALAAGGSGDVLSGLGASLLAQGFEAVDAAVAAVFVHGLAGERAAAGADRGVLASQVADAIPGIVRSFG